MIVISHGYNCVNNRYHNNYVEVSLAKSLTRGETPDP